MDAKIIGEPIGALIPMVHSMEDGQKVKIGAKDGTGFFYVGTIGNFKEKVYEYNLYLRDDLMTKHTNAKKRLDNFISNEPTFKRFVASEMHKDRPDYSKENYDNFVQEYFDGIDKRRKTIARYEFLMEHFESLSDRKVYMKFDADRIIDEDTVVLIVDGYEQGAYWKFKEVKTSPCKIATQAVCEGEASY